MSAHAATGPAIMSRAELERAFDGRIPDGLIELAKRAPQRVAAIARTRLRIRYHAKVLRARMADAIVEIFDARGGEVSEHDLLSHGFTHEEVRAHRNEAMKAARPRLRRDRQDEVA